MKNYLMTIIAILFITNIASTAIASNNLIFQNGFDVLFQHDFNNEEPHTYTLTDINDTWNASGAGFGFNVGSVRIVRDPHPSGLHGNVMQVFYAAGEIAGGGGGAVQWRTELGNVYNELYLAYDVFFATDAEFVKGGKLPGLMGGPGFYTGGNVPDGTNGWTGRLMWGGKGRVKSYMYHANQPGIYGYPFDWENDDGRIHIQRGQWNQLEIRYVMNTPGVLDGKLQAWFNGELVLDTQDVMYRTVGGEHVGIDKLLFSTFYGGGNLSWAPERHQYIYFDNFVISTQPITH
ncbi:MAG: hypothetical protein L3J22_11240 [Xanthomonadales bacterium]|nr:hypothetical protein [Xanthomonadales bacterium]